MIDSDVVSPAGGPSGHCGSPKIRAPSFASHGSVLGEIGLLRADNDRPGAGYQTPAIVGVKAEFVGSR
jgi:hypothetical protein